MKHRLRISGFLATVVFLVMVVSDLLMLTTLDFSRPYRFWAEAGGLPQAQVTLGYYLGELTIPFYAVAGWHLALAVRPGGRWAERLILGTTGYAACLFAVWHASFAFSRSILRAEAASGSTVEADFAFDTYGVPLFRVGLVVAGVGALVFAGLVASGRSLYPRGALALLLAPTAVVLFALHFHPPLPWSAILGAARYNVAGAVLFAVSTALLWNHDG
ncbi:MAG TPA: hypothetical protein VFM29_02430 [Vicinamibacteria bacterium]|nr:hypothetical protein [Vicinamibacteria bacterium]